MTIRKLLLCFSLALGLTARADNKQIILIAGAPSHGPGEHEHRAGCLLLKSCLEKAPGVLTVQVFDKWPQNPKALENADTIVLYMDGGSSHPALQENRLQQLGELMKKGTGLVCIHYAVEPTVEKGQQQFLDWIGGAFEINRSVNPHWIADFTSLPAHPIASGVKPFKLNDEWYFNMRFREGMKGVTPILTAVPTDDTMRRSDGPHEGNPGVRAAVKQHLPQTVAWACERPEGGRGFGFTGAHFHKNWGDENFRKVVLNAILWTAHAEVPPQGVQSNVSEDALRENLDPKGGK